MEPPQPEKWTCLRCKGVKALCGAPRCPLMPVYRTPEVQQKLGTQLFGSCPPNLFVGWRGWPNVLVGPLLSLGGDAALVDDPSKWYGLPAARIVEWRSGLVRSEAKHAVKASSALLSDMQALALASAPADIEMNLARSPKFSMEFSPVHQPMGPSAPLKSLRLAENPKIPTKVDRVVSDELKAVQQATTLFDSGFDVYYLTRILSAGTLGMDKSLVPTRWSITAVDDMVGKYLISRIKQLPQISDYRVYSSTYLDNHFEILLQPGAWEFEQFEAWQPGGIWTRSLAQPAIEHDWESFGGRTVYASEGGGYYAGRLGVAETLARMGRQAGATVFREIGPSYVTPVGVWEVRENVRHAMASKPQTFATLDEAVAHLSTKLKIPIAEYRKRSRILPQARLSAWF